MREFLKELESKKDKNSRIQHDQVTRYIRLLEAKGAKLLPSTIAEQIDGEIWELRPGKNRVFFFYYNHGTYVLLHHFVKKTQKTPRSEIDRANAEMADHIRQKQGEKS